MVIFFDFWTGVLGEEKGHNKLLSVSQRFEAQVMNLFSIQAGDKTTT